MHPTHTFPSKLEGDLYERYEEDDEENTEAFARKFGMDFDDVSNLKLSYIAPSIEAPRLQDEVVLLKGPDKGRFVIHNPTSTHAFLMYTSNSPFDTFISTAVPDTLAETVRSCGSARGRTARRPRLW